MAAIIKISKYLDNDLINGLHVYKIVDYSEDISLQKLLAHTSGLPDYMDCKFDQGMTGDEAFSQGIDEPWPLDRVLRVVKQSTPQFIPETKGKASYSNTNYRLLCIIIENLVALPIEKVFQNSIIDPLNLSHTYAYCDINDQTPVPMYHNQKAISVPRTMASVTAEGGVVSTAHDCMKILKSFFGGGYFPQTYIDELKQWHFCFFPYQIYLGISIEKLWLPRFNIRLLTCILPEQRINQMVWGTKQRLKR